MTKAESAKKYEQLCRKVRIYIGPRDSGFAAYGYTRNELHNEIEAAIRSAFNEGFGEGWAERGAQKERCETCIG